VFQLLGAMYINIRSEALQRVMECNTIREVTKQHQIKSYLLSRLHRTLDPRFKYSLEQANSIRQQPNTWLSEYSIGPNYNQAAHNPSSLEHRKTGRG